MRKSNIGIIGMGVMGSSLALNFLDKGYEVSVYNRSYDSTKGIVDHNPSLRGFESLSDFVESLETPRKVLLMVSAGSPIDQTIDLLIPLLSKDDIIMDGGNSNYLDTEKREKYLKSKGLKFLGIGISGGEVGARKGPSIMPSGQEDTYREVEDMLVSISAKVKGDPCVSYIGSGGSGHYVKMVHNGIEYGDMQLIAEAYHILKVVGNKDNEELSRIFGAYNEGPLNSYLIEITAEILKIKDDLSDGYLVDKIVDKASQKGTGLWTVKSSMDEAVNTSVITSAVFNRITSYEKEKRIKAQSIFPNTSHIEIDNLVSLVEKALYFSKIISYAQGYDLMTKASNMNNWNISLENISKGWRGGCIIRASFLDDIANAYNTKPELESILFDEYFSKAILENEEATREIVKIGIDSGISLSGFSNALSYFDNIRNGNNPANLIQAQRDYFGAHTYERVDRQGTFHYAWEE